MTTSPRSDSTEALRVSVERLCRLVATLRLEEIPAEHPPEIALVDIGLPDIDGDEVGRIIRSQPGGDGVYLVALTGLGAPADVDNALWAGFDSYMVKPVDPEKLTEVIAHAHR